MKSSVIATLFALSLVASSAVAQTPTSDKAYNLYTGPEQVMRATEAFRLQMEKPCDSSWAKKPSNGTMIWLHVRSFWHIATLDRQGLLMDSIKFIEVRNSAMMADFCQLTKSHEREHDSWTAMTQQEFLKRHPVSEIVIYAPTPARVRTLLAECDAHDNSAWRRMTGFIMDGPQARRREEDRQSGCKNMRSYPPEFGGPS